MTKTERLEYIVENHKQALKARNQLLLEAQGDVLVATLALWSAENLLKQHLENEKGQCGG